MWDRKISVAPNFYLHEEYFKVLSKAFKEWDLRNYKKIEKKYTKKRISAIIQEKFPLAEEEENRIRNSLKGAELRRWEKESLKRLLCLIEMNDASTHFVSFYYSFYIYLFSDFENIINKICTEFSKKHATNVGLKDLNGSGIERAFLFLKKVAKLSLPDTDELILFRDIRNCLAHSAGYTSDAGFIKRLEKYGRVDILEEDYPGMGRRIMFSREFSLYSIEEIGKFLKKLVQMNLEILWTPGLVADI